MEKRNFKVKVKIGSFLLFFMFVSSSFGWAASYYVDFSAGSDANGGTAASAPFKHSPGDPAASGLAASTTLRPGDTVYFKKGVTYAGQVNVGQSGSETASGSSGSITASGVLSDFNANFSGVSAGDYIYIYNNSPTGSYNDSLGFWKILSVNSQTQISLENYSGKADSKAQLPYRIYRPISYTSMPTWGSGAAVLTGSLTRNYIFNLNGKSYIRIEGLSLENTRNPATDGCSTTNYGAIWYNNTLRGIVIENNRFSNVWSGIAADYLTYSVVQGNTLSNVIFLGLTGGDWALVQNNTINGAGRGMASIRKYGIIRHNNLFNIDHESSQMCGNHADSMQFMSSSLEPGGAKYAWIYGNVFTNVTGKAGVQFISLAGQIKGGMSYWTIQGNVFVGSNNGNGGGDMCLDIRGTDHLKVYNNTFFAINNTHGFNSAIKLWYLTSNVDVRNNIFYGGTNSLAGGITVESDSTTGFVSKGNMYYYVNRSTPFKWAGSLKSWSQWKSLGNDNDGYSHWNVDPMLVDTVGTDWPAINLRLQPGSPAVNSPYSLPVDSRDAAKVFLPAFGSWDRGAYELTGGNNTPAGPMPPQKLTVW